MMEPTFTDALTGVSGPMSKASDQVLGEIAAGRTI